MIGIDSHRADVSYCEAVPVISFFVNCVVKYPSINGLGGAVAEWLACWTQAH